MIQLTSAERKKKVKAVIYLDLTEFRASLHQVSDKSADNINDFILYCNYIVGYHFTVVFWLSRDLRCLLYISPSSHLDVMIALEKTKGCCYDCFP